MSTQPARDKEHSQVLTNDPRSRLLAGTPATERRIELAGLSTALLEGGDGPPVILLHGPGESAFWWMRVIPRLVDSHRVIVPDLPGHGATDITDETLDQEFVFRWLGELIDRTCSARPLLAGHLLGGSIAARYAVEHRERIERLVLVNSLGLGKFRPSPKFAFGLIRFMIWPTRENYDRFLPQCMYDPDDLGSKMGTYWEPFLAYNIECAQNPDRQSALRELMKEIGVPKIPNKKLQKIGVPTTLIWGKHDRANKLSIAEEASNRFGWPLHVIDESRDDPKLERPEAVVQAFYRSLNTGP